MPITFIDFDSNTAVGRMIARGLQMPREGRDVLRNALAVMATMIDGDGSDAAHFTRLATEAGYENTAAAKSSWDELNSLYAKLNAPSGTGDSTGAAITQACAKHGI